MGSVRVLVTRPQPGADRTAAHLAALGFEPVLLPLTQTLALPQRLPDDRPDLVVATSPQAFHHLSLALREALASARVLVTGEGTAAAATEAGLTRAETSGGNVSGLIDALAGMELSGTRILYLAGKVRRPDLENFLQGRAVPFDVCEAYDTVSVSYSADKLAAFSVGGNVTCVLVTSVETIIAMAAISSAVFTQAIENAMFVCLSDRIASAACSHFPNRILVAAEPTTKGLFQCLIEAFPRA